MAKHTFTWLKVMGFAFLAYCIIFFSRNGISSFSINTFLGLVCYILIPGFLLGYIFNLFVNFKRAALWYSIGHIVFMSVVMYFAFRNETKDLVTKNQQDWNTEFPKITDLNKEHLDCIQKSIESKSNNRKFIVFMILVQDKNDSIVSCFSQNKPNEVRYSKSALVFPDNNFTKYSVFFAFTDNTDKVLYSEYVFRQKKYKIMHENELVTNSTSMQDIHDKIQKGNKLFKDVDSVIKTL